MDGVLHNYIRMTKIINIFGRIIQYIPVSLRLKLVFCFIMTSAHINMYNRLWLVMVKVAS